MSRHLIVRPEAEADITNAAVWYESREPGLGLRFTAELGSAISRALKSPEAFMRMRRNSSVRRVLTRRFATAFSFIDRSDALIVFAVLHAARHDWSWERRANRPEV